MGPFYELKSSDEQETYLRMYVNAELIVGINIYFVKGAWRWTYSSWDKNASGSFEEVLVENERFILEREIKNVDVTNEFHLFIKQLKKHPNYRLKVLNRLSEEIRPIWNAL